VSVTKIPAQLEAALVREALLKKQVSKIQAENDKLQSKIDTAIEQLNEHIHIHVDMHQLDDILFDLEGGCDSFKLELCDEY
jgi:hypothetical protein